MVSVLDHVSEGCGVRKTSRLRGGHRDTVSRYSLLAGEHAHDLHAVLVALSRVVLGLHYPTDVVAGAAIGYALATVSTLLRHLL